MKCSPILGQRELEFSVSGKETPSGGSDAE